ncbi:hypothetical protein ACN38_g9243 [Penicillium nordicum]|uniref:Uncharacterized protein n=1 Tax=Penicillium nordicum TaxID=229535 RepID=A0A0N0RY42_9EURO|nr:hypothetical protein ACN38_g9243 [Penicillium nordicum]
MIKWKVWDTQTPHNMTRESHGLHCGDNSSDPRFHVHQTREIRQGHSHSLSLSTSLSHSTSFYTSPESIIPSPS